MKKREPLRWNIKVALLAAIVSLLSLSAWRDVAVYLNYQSNHVQTVASQCVSVSMRRTDEPRLHSFFTVFCLELADGTTVAVYKDTADALFPSENASDQIQAFETQFVTDQPITFFRSAVTRRWQSEDSEASLCSWPVCSFTFRKSTDISPRSASDAVSCCGAYSFCAHFPIGSSA